MSDIPILTRANERVDEINALLTDVNKPLYFLKDVGSKIYKELSEIKDLQKEAAPAKALPAAKKAQAEDVGRMYSLDDKFSQMLSFLRPQKLSPKRNVMLNHSPESVYIADSITGKLDDVEEEKEKGFLSKLFSGSGLTAGIGGMMSKLGPMAAIAGGLVWGAVDGIKGYFEAENWGVSKVAGALGGFFAGPGEGGLKDAFKNMGKWALIGAGVGSIVPGIGTIAGGLVGAAFGGILGLFGGKKIAQSFDKLGKWFADIWQSEFMGGVRNFMKDLPANLVKGIQSVLGFLDREITSFSSDPGAWAADKWKGITGAIGDFFGFIGSFIGERKEAATGWIQENLINGVFRFFDNVGSGIKRGADAVWGWLQSNLINPMKDFFFNIGSFFGFLGSLDWKNHPIEAFKTLALSGGGGLAAYRQSEIEQNVQAEGVKALGRDFARMSPADQIKALRAEGLYVAGMNEYTSGNDMVIQPNGKMFRTAPGDTIVATRSPVRAINDSEVDGVMQRAEQDALRADKTATMVTLLQQAVEKLSGEGRVENNIVNQNFTSKYTPANIMDALVMGVE